MSSNITSMTGDEPETSAEAICARIDAIVAPFDGDLAAYLKGDHRTPIAGLVKKARAVARLLEEVTDQPEMGDNTVFSNAGSLVEGLLAMAEGVEYVEMERDPAVRAARKRAEGSSHDE